MCYARFGVFVLFDSLLPLIPKVLVAQFIEYFFVDVVIEGIHADRRLERVLFGRSQSCRRGKPVYNNLVFNVGGKGVVIADLQRSAFGRLVVVVCCLSPLGGIPALVIIPIVVQILPAFDLVVNGLPRESQLPGNVADRFSLIQQGFQSNALFFRHVMSHEYPQYFVELIPVY